MFTDINFVSTMEHLHLFIFFPHHHDAIGAILLMLKHCFKKSWIKEYRYADISLILLPCVNVAPGKVPWSGRKRRQSCTYASYRIDLHGGKPVKSQWFLVD